MKKKVKYLRGPGGSVWVENSIDDFEKEFKEEAKERAIEIGHLIRNEVLEGMTGPKHGERRKVPGTKRYYLASRPGEFPAVATGRLRTSIAIVVETKEKEVLVRVGTKVEYGVFLNFGTVTMGARPWLMLAYKKALPEIRKVLRRPWGK